LIRLKKFRFASDSVVGKIEYSVVVGKSQCYQDLKTEFWLGVIGLNTPQLNCAKGRVVSVG
jgi:hypothetical protein